MTQINELLSSLCPNGVEYKPIKAIATIKNGKDYKSLEKGDVPVYGSGGAMGVFVNQASHTGPTVLLPRKGSVSNVFYADGPIWNVDTVFYTEIDEKHMLPRFFYHVMLNVHIEELATNSAARPSLTQSELYRIVVPVPPLEVQREIVRILDSFMELEAELEARRMQYTYYRDQLLSRENLEKMSGNKVDVIKLGTIATIRTGQKPTQIDKVGTSDYPYVNAGTTLSGSVRAFNTEGDTVTTPSRGQGGIGYVGYQKNRFWCGPLCYRIRATQETLSNRYLYYALQSKSNGIIALKNEGGTPAVNAKDLKQLNVLLPPFPVQQRVVDILDRFDALTSSLTDGLPAEIEARRRQYEYYRDRLLDFPRKEADS